MTILDFARLVRRGVLFIVTLALVGGAIGALSSQLQPRRYSSSATLLVTAAPSSSPAEGQGGNQLAQSRAQLLASLAVSDEVLAQAQTSIGGDMSLTDLRASVTATSTESTNITTISGSAGTAEDAVRVVEAVVRAVTELGESLDAVAAGASDQRTILIREISQPQFPERAYLPQPRNATIAGLAAGLAAALIILTVREVGSQRVRGANDVRALALGFPIAIIERRNVLPLLRTGSDNARESYRYLRSTLLHALGRRGLIAVTSVSHRTSGGDLGSALGEAIFEVGSSVLIVDARLRQTSTSDESSRKWMSRRASPEPLGTLKRAAPLTHSVTTARYESLSEETAQLASRRGLQSLADPAFAAQIRAAAADFDFAVVLLPSMADCAEAAVAAASADAAVLQIDAGTTRRGEVLLAHQRLRASGVREVVGAVVGASRLDLLPSTSIL